MQVIISGSAISGYLEACDDEYAQTHVVDGTDVTTQVLCDDLPCTAGTVDGDEAMSYLRGFIDSLATDGYEVDEFIIERRGYGSGERVDAIIDT